MDEQQRGRSGGAGDKRRIGRSSLQVAPLCFGGNVFGWTADEAMSFSLLDAYTGAGFDFIDTADVYSKWVPGHVGGESETVIGNWLRRSGARDKVVIATKVGMDMGPAGKGLRAAHIKASCDRSLARLGTDRIDLYYSHTDDRDTPFEETLGAYADLIAAGKVRAIGASYHDAARLREALDASRRLGLPRYEMLQPEYNLYARRGYESALESLCLEESLGVAPYYSLASGFLTGKYRSEADFGKSPRGGRMAAYLDDRGLAILAALDEVAQATGSTPARVAVAWLMGRPGLVAPIASATSVGQLDELMAAARLRLDDAATARLDAASAWR
jgi:aryl-alcohol dehydrogenase-like predicted oxidoreductase